MTTTTQEPRAVAPMDAAHIARAVEQLRDTLSAIERHAEEATEPKWSATTVPEAHQLPQLAALRELAQARKELDRLEHVSVLAFGASGVRDTRMAIALDISSEGLAKRHGRRAAR